MEEKCGKILYILDCKLNTIGGSQKSSATIINGMIKKKYDVTVISPFVDKISGELYNKNVKYIFFKEKKNKIINMINKMLFIKRFFYENNNFDIVHLQNPPYFIIIAIMLKIKLLTKNNSKFIYTDREFFDSYSWKYKLIFKIAAKMFDQIICTTSINQNLWKSVNNNVDVISNSLEDFWYDYSKEFERRVKDEKNILTKVNIGFSGRFVAYKRWDNVLKICESLKDDSNITFSFAIASSDEKNLKEINEYKERLEKILGDNVLFLLNASKEQMIEFYYLIDIFILTSEGESFGRTLLESMTKSNVVFGTNSGGVPDVIKNKSFLFEVDDIEYVIEKIKNYSCDNKLLEKDKKLFINYVRENFSCKKMIDDHQKLYNKLNVN